MTKAEKREFRDFILAEASRDPFEDLRRIAASPGDAGKRLTAIRMLACNLEHPPARWDVVRVPPNNEAG